MFSLLRKIADLMGPKSSASGFYAIRRGRTPGIVRSWAECEKLVKGFPGARYKKFSTEVEAREFVAGKDSPAVTEKVAEVDSSSIKELGKAVKRKTPFAATGQSSNGTAETKKSRKAIKSEPTTSDADRPVVYTDGACSKNGTADARAGIGVYWGDGDPRNVSECLEGRPTNNRAEIHAAIKAIRQARSQGFDKIEVRTDSNFLIKSITQWVHGWQRKNWKLANGQDVVNRKDFEELLEAQKGIDIRWTHVAGHAGIAGNEAADRLAVAGLDKPIIRLKQSPGK